MKANYNSKRRMNRDDEGVSPVIAVILMVAITVVLAATVYVWVSGFSSDDSGPESAQVRASGFDEDNDGATDWIRLNLVRGENAPYSNSVVDFTLLNHNAAAYDGTDDVCTAVNAGGAICATGEDFENDASDTEWSVGEVLYVPCEGDGPHQVTISIRDSTVLDERVNCDEVAA